MMREVGLYPPEAVCGWSKWSRAHSVRSFGIVLIPALPFLGMLDFAGSSLRQLRAFLFVDLLI